MAVHGLVPKMEVVCDMCDLHTTAMAMASNEPGLPLSLNTPAWEQYVLLKINNATEEDT